MNEQDPDHTAIPPYLHEVLPLLSHLAASRAEYQRRARSWMKTSSFREVYDAQHFGLVVKVIATLMRRGSALRVRSGGLWKNYQRLAAEGELVFAANVIGNAAISENPWRPYPAAVLVPAAQDANGLLDALLFADKLTNAYLLGEGADIPQSAKIIADDEYRPFRRRALPASETGGAQLVLHDVRMRGVDMWEAVSPPFIPVLTDPRGRVFTVVPWHVVLGRPAPPNPLPPTRAEAPAASVPPPLPNRGAEVSPGGSAVLRHQPREKPFELATSDGSTADLVEAHVSRYLGEVGTVFHELISDLVHLDVLFVPATPERPFHTLVTSGMSDRPMTVPPGAEDFRHAELMLCLPADWPMGTDANGQNHFDDERHYWPVRWLKKLARLPHEYDTWLAPLHTVPNGDPAEPVAPGVPFTGFILGPAFTVPDEFHHFGAGPGKNIRFYAVFPVTAAEMDLKLQHGGETLLAALAQRGVSEIVDVQRASVA